MLPLKLVEPPVGAVVLSLEGTVVRNVPAVAERERLEKAKRLPRLITPPEAAMVIFGAVKVADPATAVAPARVRLPELVMLRLTGVADAANQAGPVLVESAPVRIEP